MTPNDLKLLAGCLSVIIIAGLVTINRIKWKRYLKSLSIKNESFVRKVTKPRRRNIPIAHAYAEMLHIILNAQRVEEMNCIDCLISNMYTDYEGVVNYSDIANFENDIKNEQLKKRLELLHVEEFELCLS